MYFPPWLGYPPLRRAFFGLDPGVCVPVVDAHGPSKNYCNQVVVGGDEGLGVVDIVEGVLSRLLSSLNIVNSHDKRTVDGTVSGVVSETSTKVAVRKARYPLTAVP